jgi:ferrochelatase
MKKRILILVNTGTPDKPDVKHVRRYLAEFLNDKRVIDLPWLWRKILVNLIIVPFRAPKSARLYEKIWTNDGSPLAVNMEKLVRRVQEKVDSNTVVMGAMRYGNPSLSKVLRDIPRQNAGEVVIFPLYPQYATSTNGSVEDLVRREAGKWNANQVLKLKGQFYSNPYYVEALSAHIRHYQPEKFDHIVFSYHGLPLSHVRRLHPQTDPDKCGCEERMPDHGGTCYKATCYETTRIMASKLHLDSARYSVSFQSRMSEKWLTPFTDAVLKNLAQTGKKRVLVIAPSFAADCLETIEEISHGYKEIFISHGGKDFELVASLNDNEKWAEAVAAIYCE